MRHRLIFNFILIVLSAQSKAQEYSVTSFEPALKDLTARATNTSRVDGNGRKCAVIKVYADDNIAAVRGNVIGDISVTGMEKWIYLSHDSKDMEIVFDHHLPLLINFIDYDVPTLTGQMTYVLKLKDESNVNSTGTNIIRTPATNQYTENIMDHQPDQKELTSVEMFEKGYAAEQRTNYPEAVEWYRKSAELGNDKAQCALGWMYSNGKGLMQNKEEAVKWYLMSANQGNDVAQWNLGHMYEIGDGVAQNYSKAVHWYRKAAEQGSARGQCELGWMYRHGTGVIQDNSEALKWYRLSAEQGFARAQFNLGYMYEKGYGVIADLSEAKRWYEKAAAQGSTQAKQRIKVLNL